MENNDYLNTLSVKYSNKELDTISDVREFIDSRDDSCPEQTFWFFIMKCRLDILKFLYEEPKYKLTKKNLDLRQASYTNDIEIIKYFIRNGAEDNIGFLKDTALMKWYYTDEVIKFITEYRLLKDTKLGKYL